MTSSKKVTNSLALELIDVHSIEKVLYVNLSNFGLFQEILQDCFEELNTWDEKPTSNDFGLVVADLPLGMRTDEWQAEDGRSKIRIQKNWIKILQSLAFLDNHSIGLFAVEPNILWTKGESFRNELGRLGFQIKAVFNTPKEILHPETSLQPTIILISRGITDKIFIAELFDIAQVVQVVDNFTNHINTPHLSSGTTVNNSDFKSFHHFKIARQIELLETQYKEYSKYMLADVAVEINSVRSGMKFEERENAIYIPKLGESSVTSDLKEAKLKHHNYYQVTLNDKIARCEYVVSFFSSALGRLVLKSLSSQTFIPHINKSDLLNATIAIPELNEQEVVIETHEKLSELKSTIDNFEQELALNPTSALTMQDQITKLLGALGTLTESDRVLALVHEGESKTVEFKQTLSLNIDKQKRKKLRCLL